LSYLQDKCVEFGSVEDKGGAIGVAGVAHSDQSTCQSGEFSTIPIRVAVAAFAPYRAAQQGCPRIVSGLMHSDLFAGFSSTRALLWLSRFKRRDNQAVTVPTSFVAVTA
jgi:hypothetical protein